MKINDAYYREVLLTQKLLSVMREICGEFFIFQQGNVHSFIHIHVKQVVRPQLNTMRSAWDNLPSETDTCVHFTRPFAIQQHRSETDWLQKYERNAAAGLASSWRRWTEAAVDRCLASFQAKRYRWRSWWVAQMSLSVNSCKRKTFWAFNLTPIMHMLFCISCLLILWRLSKCYCVKCGRISPITFFYISQNSAETQLRCGGQCGMRFVANVLEITRKNFENRRSFVKVMNECIVAQFFLTHCVVIVRSSFPQKEYNGHCGINWRNFYIIGVTHTNEMSQTQLSVSTTIFQYRSVWTLPFNMSDWWGWLRSVQLRLIFSFTSCRLLICSQHIFFCAAFADTPCKFSLHPCHSFYHGEG